MPGAGSRNVISETVVSLQADIDNAGIDKLLGLLDANKMKAFALSGALAAVTTGVYKFIEGIVKQEFELEKLAKKKQKSIDQTRAEETALKQMGMTLEEIKKDGALKSMYDDLVKFNKELEMPNMTRALGNVNKLRTEFYKLKSALQYALTAIGNQVLTNLEAPMERVGGKMRSAAEWIKNNLTPIATKIGTVISDFIKGVVGIAEVVGKIVNWVTSLPSHIKGIGAAITAVFLLLKSGPLGQILAIVTLIGDLIHDYENFQWNKANREDTKFWAANNEQGWTDNIAEALLDENGNAIAYQVDTAFDNIYEIIDDDTKTTKEKIGDVATEIVTTLTDALGNAFSDPSKYLVGGMFGNAGEGGGIFGGIIDWLNDNSNAIADLGTAIITFIRNSLTSAGALVGSGAGALFNALLGDGTIPEEVLNDEETATAFAGGLGTFLFSAIEKIKKGDSLFGAFKGAFKDGILGSIIGALIANITEDDAGNITIEWEKIPVNLTKTGEAFLGIIKASIRTVKGLGSFVLGQIGDSLKGMKLTGTAIDEFSEAIGGIFKEWSEDPALSSAISTAATVLFTGGSIMDSIVSGIVGAFFSAQDEAMGKAVKQQLLDQNVPEDIADNLVKGFIDHGEIQKKFDELPDEYKASMWADTFSGLGAAAENLLTGLWTALLEGLKGANHLGAQLIDMLTQAIVDLINPDSADVQLEDNALAGGIGTAIGTALAGGNFWLSLFSGIVSTFTELQSRVGTGEGQYATLWDALEADAGKFWNQILDIWLGPLSDPDNPNSARIAEKGLASVIMPIIEKILHGEDGNSGLAGIWDSIVSAAKTAFDEIAKYATAVADIVLYKIEHALANSTLGGILRELGWIAEEEPTGEKLILTENGGITTLGAAVESGMPFGDIVQGMDRFNKDPTMQMLLKKGLITTEGYGASFVNDPDFQFEMAWQKARTPEAKQAVIDSYLEYQSTGNSNLITDATMMPKYQRAFVKRVSKNKELMDAMGYLMLAEQYYSDENGEYDESVINPEAVRMARMKVANYMYLNEGYYADRPEDVALLDSLISNPLETFAEFPEIIDGIVGDVETAAQRVSELETMVLSHDYKDDTTYGFEFGGKTWRIKRDKDGLFDFRNAEWQDEDGSWSKQHSLEHHEPDSKFPFSYDIDLDDKALSEAYEKGQIKLVPVQTELEMPDTSGFALKVSQKVGKVKLDTELTKGDQTFGAYGGRYDRTTSNMTIGEDGTEYLIPITKRERAFSLINQMLSEMGSSAIHRVVEGFGLGESGSIASSPERMNNVLEGMRMANTYNISAPISINVNASGANGKEIGTSIYDSAERHLIKTLRGVVA